MLRAGLVLVLLTLAGQAAGVGTAAVSDPTGDVSFSSYYSVAGLRARNVCWALEIECSQEEEMTQENLVCEAPSLDITEVAFAVASDGLIQGSLTVADLDAELRCLIRQQAATATLHTPDHAQSYATLRLESGGQRLALSRHTIDSDVWGSIEEWIFVLNAPGAQPLCFDSGWWRAGNTIGFALPSTGTAQRCCDGQTVEYAFTGSATGHAGVMGLGMKRYADHALKWNYFASDGVAGPTGPIQIP